MPVSDLSQDGLELRHANYFAEPTHFLFSTTKQLGPEDNPGSGAANGL